MSLRTTVLALPLALTAALTAAASPAFVATTVAGPITCEDLTVWLEHSGPRATRKAAEQTTAEWKEDLVRRLAVQEGLATRAVELGVLADPEFAERWRATVTSTLLRTLEEDLEAGVDVTEAEVRRAFEERREELTRPEMITTRFIIRHVADTASEATWRREAELLRRIRQRALAGEAFGALARELSHAENSGRGGAVRTSPRGSLLAAFEEVAWELEVGEISDVVRLPDGPAVILLERRLEAAPAEYERSREAIRTQLQAERVGARRDQALAEGCGRWPLGIDAWTVAANVAAGNTLLRVGGETLDLAEREVLPDAPWWPERLEATLEQHCLESAARRRGVAERPAVADSLATARRRLMAAWATDRLVQARKPPVSEEAVRDLYEEHRQAFATEEERTLEVVEVPISGGDQREAQRRASRLAEAWARTGDSTGVGEPTPRRWRPLKRSELASLVSPLVATAVFEAEPGVVEGPVLLESYDPVRFQFRPRSYIAFRVAAVEPAGLTPPTEAREKIERFALRGTWSRLAAEVAAEAGEASQLRLDAAALALCPLDPRADLRAQGD